MAATDIIDVDAAFEGINMVGGGAKHGARLATVTTLVSRRIDAICGPVVARSVTETKRRYAGRLWLDDWVSWGQWPNSAAQTVTTVTEYVSGTGTVLTGETLTTTGGYLVEDGELMRRSEYSQITWSGPVAVTYVAGRFATTSVVDDFFREACMEIVERIWQQYAPAWARGGGDVFGAAEGTGFGFFRAVDPIVTELLAYERRPPAIG